MASSDNKPKPKLIVFDLDYTLWPFWTDTHVDPPFRKSSDGKVYDARGWHVKMYPDVPEILDKLQKEGYKMAIASRTTYDEEANELVRLFDWNKYFPYKEIFDRSKVEHMKRFKDQSGVDYKDMLFFDDEHRNMVECGKIGVTCIFIKNGMSMKVLQEGFSTFAKNRQAVAKDDL